MIDLASYKLPPGSNEPRGPLSDADLAMTKSRELAQFIPIFAPKDIYASPMGGMNLGMVSYNDLRTAGATPTDDSFLLAIQFVNINVAGGFKPTAPAKSVVPKIEKNKEDSGDDNSSAQATGTDPVLAYGPLYSLPEYMKMLRSGDPGQFRNWVQGIYGQPGTGGGGDQTKANEAMVELLNAPNVKAAISAVLTSGL